MSATSKINKENFRLLDLSSDEESEDLQLEIIPSRKKKITRRERSKGLAPQAPEPNIGQEVQCALRWAVRGTLLLWLLMLTWICATLYDQVSNMKIHIDEVSTRSDSVGDALQICHAAAKSLRTNVSDLNDRLTNLEKYHSELSSRVDNATKGLQSVTSQLEATPNIVDMPKRLNELQRTVADFGSQIKSFESSFNLTKRQASTAIAGVDELKTLLNQLEIKTNETAANVTANIKRDEDLKTHIDSLNSTLETKMTALLARMEENNKSTSAAAPTAAVSTPSSTTLTASNGTTQAPTLPPAPPAKPNVLQ
ncbi:hypothetical protein K1T71_010337 [Dendrolimus kikuchii]|uniref:Uncharacterized protein n=1 Tax=Dendrolimus kikuchii TaxID=765133 RepID=A0ACC1CRG2_9NEOP|nr:hypothetical protein K1T71_010337 [Dendrolimus kikuchii]